MAEWWKTSFGRLEKLKQRGFKEVYEMFFLVQKYYTLEQIIKELTFNPIVKDFNPEKDISKLKELEKKYRTQKGIKITADPLILFGENSPTLYYYKDLNPTNFL